MQSSSHAPIFDLGKSPIKCDWAQMSKTNFLFNVPEKLLCSFLWIASGNGQDAWIQLLWSGNESSYILLFLHVSQRVDHMGVYQNTWTQSQALSVALTSVSCDSVMARCCLDLEQKRCFTLKTKPKTNGSNSKGRKQSVNYKNTVLLLCHF